MKRAGLILSILAVSSLCLVTMASENVHGIAYGAGEYGTCEYDTCNISLTSDGSVTLDVTPTASTSCSVARDEVGVSTASSTGYTLSFTDTAATATMTGSHGGTINAAAGTTASPAQLTANSWGYRVDGTGAFGNGPTAARSNGAIPSETYAAIPGVNDTPATLKSVTQTAPSPDTTNVWYGLCVNTTIPAGSYESNVMYTAVVN